MGMDVYGKKPECKAGEYFRASVWTWRPLWVLCECIGTVKMKGEEEPIIPSDNPGQLNQGWGLDEEASKKLSRRLMFCIANGTAKQLADSTPMKQITNAILKEIPWPEQVFLQENVNKVESLLPTEYEVESLLPTEYELDMEIVQEFAIFLDRCGGFEIW